MTIPVRVYVASAVLLLPSTLSCSKKVSNLEIDSNFTPAKLTAGGLGLGGVVSILEESPDPLLESNQDATQLQHALEAKRKDLEVFPWGQVRQAAGDTTALLCLRDFRDHGALASALLDTLSSRLGPRPRYPS